MELEVIQAGLKEEAEREANLAKTTLWENMKVFIFNYRYWLLIVYYSCHASIFWGIMSWLPSYLKLARGFSWAAMGIWSSVSYVFATLSVILVGYLSDKVGRRAPFNVMSMSLAAAGMYFGALADNNIASVALISLANAALGLGMPISWAILQEMVPAKAIGTGAGIMNGCSNGIAAFSPVLIGLFISLTGGYIGGLMFIVVMALLAATCAVVLVIQKY